MSTVQSNDQRLSKAQIDNLEKALKQNNFENIQLIVDKICNLANERNRQLKLLN